MKFNKEERAWLRGAFAALEGAEIEYAVLRTYEGLPGAIARDSAKRLDIDLLAAAAQFDKAIGVLGETGFAVGAPRRQKSNGWRRVARAARRPVRTLRKLLGKSKRALHRMVRSVFQAGSSKGPEGASPYRMALADSCRLRVSRGRVLLDVKCHLTHVSPMNGARIRVDPWIEGQFLRHRRRVGSCFFAPSAPDELAHLIAHCVFEYEGAFDEYYTDRCNALAESVYGVASGRRDRDRFEALLQRYFFGGAPVVVERVRSGRFSEIRPALRRFAGY